MGMAIFHYDHRTLMPPFLIQLQNLFQTSALRLQTLTELRINIIKAIRTSHPVPDSTTRRSIDQLSRHVRLLGKFFRRLQQLNVSRFVEQPMCSDIVLYYWSKVVEATNAPSGMISGASAELKRTPLTNIFISRADSNEAVYPVRFLVQAMVLFKESLAQWTPTPKKGVPNSNSTSRHLLEIHAQIKLTVVICLSSFAAIRRGRCQITCNPLHPIEPCGSGELDV
jgi:hypothetical protein